MLGTAASSPAIDYYQVPLEGVSSDEIRCDGYLEFDRQVDLLLSEFLRIAQCSLGVVKIFNFDQIDLIAGGLSQPIPCVTAFENESLFCEAYPIRNRFWVRMLTLETYRLPSGRLSKLSSSSVRKSLKTTVRPKPVRSRLNDC